MHRQSQRGLKQNVTRHTWTYDLGDQNWAMGEQNSELGDHDFLVPVSVAFPAGLRLLFVLLVFVCRAEFVLLSPPYVHGAVLLYPFLLF